MKAEELMHKIDQKKFNALVAAKWTVSLLLTALMLSIYYGFVLILAFRKDILSQTVGENMTLGIPVGLGVIISACLVTGIYVAWANKSYDKSVKEITSSMRGL